MAMVDFRKLAKAAAVAADDKKAEDIIVLDVRKESDVTDYMVIVGAQSAAQLRALDGYIRDELKDLGAHALRREGRRNKQRWLAIDYGGLVVHILLTEARDFYRLEGLFEKAKSVKWD